VPRGPGVEAFRGSASRRRSALANRPSLVRLRHRLRCISPCSRSDVGAGRPEVVVPAFHGIRPPANVRSQRTGWRALLCSSISTSRRSTWIRRPWPARFGPQHARPSSPVHLFGLPAEMETASLAIAARTNPRTESVDGRGPCALGASYRRGARPAAPCGPNRLLLVSTPRKGDPTTGEGGLLTTDDAAAGGGGCVGSGTMAQVMAAGGRWDVSWKAGP